MQVERAGVGLGVGPPYPLIQHIPVEHKSPVSQQRFKQIKLPPGQPHRCAVLCYLPRAGVKHNPKSREQHVCPPGAAQHSLHPGQQFSRGKRFENIIFRPEPQPAYPVGYGSLCCHKQRRGAGGLQIAQQFVTVDLRQHDVEHGE